MFKKILFVAWLLGVAGVFAYAWVHHISLDTIRATVASIEEVSIVLYAALYIFGSLVFFPTALLTIMATALFDPVTAFLVTYVGENVSATIAFWVGRYFGRGTVSRHKHPLIQKYNAKLLHHGFQTLFLLRLLPFVPFDLLNYASGTSHMRYRDYTVATLLGIIPSLLAYILVGASVFYEPRYLIPAGMFCIVFGYCIHIAQKKLQKKSS